MVSKGVEKNIVGEDTAQTVMHYAAGALVGTSVSAPSTPVSLLPTSSQALGPGPFVSRTLFSMPRVPAQGRGAVAGRAGVVCVAWCASGHGAMSEARTPERERDSLVVAVQQSGLVAVSSIEVLLLRACACVCVCVCVLGWANLI